MNEKNNFSEIINLFKEGKLSSKEFIDNIISIYDKSENRGRKLSVLELFNQFSFKEKIIFEFLKEKIHSEQDILLKSSSSKLLLLLFPELSFGIIKTLIRDNNSTYFLNQLQNALDLVDSQYSEDLTQELKGKLAVAYDICPEESIFFLNLSTLVIKNLEKDDYVIGYYPPFRIKTYIDVGISFGSGGERFYSVNNGHITGLLLWDFNKLPDSIKMLSRLKYLNLDRCGMKSLPESLHPKCKLKYLNLNGNNFLNLPKWVLDFAQKNYFNNKYIKEGVLASEVYVLGLLDILSNAHFRKVNNDYEFGCEYGKYYKTNNDGHIVGICIDFPEDTWIGLFPVQICNLKYLEELYLPNNQIKEIPNCITNLKSLKRLDLSRNEINIKDIPKLIKSFLNSLKWLNI